MNTYFTIFILILISFNTMGKNNKHPMKIAMVSVFVEDPSKAFKYYTEVIFKKDPVKIDWGYEAIFDDANGNYIQLIQITNSL